MSLLFFAGFDNFGGGLQGGTGYGQEFPAKGAGIVGTPYEALLPITYGNAGALYNSMGVPNDDRWRIGAGSQRRNMLIAACGGSTSSYFAMAQVGPTFTQRPTSSYWSMTLGLNLCDFSAAVPAGGFYSIRVRRAAATLGYLCEHTASSTDQWRLGGNSPQLPIVRGQPVYLEFVIDTVNPAASGTVQLRCRVYVNGELYHTNNAWASLTASTTNYDYAFEIGYDRVLTADRRIGFSDIYVLDHLGEAPFNERLGPQLVLPYKPTAVNIQDFVVVGGSDPLTTVTDNNDATYLNSQVGRSNMSFDADLNLSPGSQVNALAAFARVRRDDGAPRTFVGTGARVDGTVIPNSAGIGTALATNRFVLGHQILPKSATERQALDFPDSGKLRFGLTTEQPG